jgi:hypothetical protein
MLLKNKKKREEATERTSLDLVGYSHTHGRAQAVDNGYSKLKVK